jgi:hypothetical protein
VNVTDEQLTAAGLGGFALGHALLEHEQLGLGHRPLEPEQQPVVVGRWVVEAVLVGDERADSGAHREDLVPIAARARQRDISIPKTTPT